MNHQVVVLAAGQSSRFFPFNDQHKSLFPICGRPIIAYTLDGLRKAGFNQAIIVVSDKHHQTAISQHAPKGLDLIFAIQPQPLGQGNAILSAAPHLKTSFFVINAPQINFDQHIKPHLNRLDNPDFVGAVLRQQTDNPQKYGMLNLEGEIVRAIVEKPASQDTPSNWRTVGTYLFTPDFLNILQATPPEQYQLEAAINASLTDHKFIALETIVDYPSLKYSWDLLTFKNYILDSLPKSISEKAHVAATATIRGDVYLAPGASVHDYALIEGPAFIGEAAVIGAYSQVRKGTCIEAGAKLQRYVDAKNSLISRQVSIHSGFVGDSVIGESVRIGADFVTANRRLDRQTIAVAVKDSPTDTHMDFLGCLIGPHSTLGIKVATMPGTIIGPSSTLGPGVLVKSTHSSGSKLTQSNL